MKTRVRLGVAGRTLALRADRPWPALRLPRAYRPFLKARGNDIVIDVVPGAGPSEDPRRRLFASGGTWNAYGLGGDLLYSFRAQGPARPPDRLLRIDRDLRRGVLYVPFPSSLRQPDFALGYPLDDLVFQHHLARRKELVVHGAGLVIGGRAVILAGASGAGKTTATRLWRRLRPGVGVLSDDRLVVRAHRGAYWAFGTPWHGEGRFASPEGRPLAAIFFLRQARRTEVVPLGSGDAGARLFSLTFPPRWDRLSVARTLSTCIRVARTTPAFELGFRPDRSAVEAVLGTLNVNDATETQRTHRERQLR